MDFSPAASPRYTYFMLDSVLTAKEAHYVPILRSGPTAPQHPQGFTLPLPSSGSSGLATLGQGYVDVPMSQLPDSSCSRQWTLTLSLQASRRQILFDITPLKHQHPAAPFKTYDTVVLTNLSLLFHTESRHLASLAASLYSSCIGLRPPARDHVSKPGRRPGPARRMAHAPQERRRQQSRPPVGLGRAHPEPGHLKGSQRGLGASSNHDDGPHGVHIWLLVTNVPHLVWHRSPLREARCR